MSKRPCKIDPRIISIINKYHHTVRDLSKSSKLNEVCLYSALKRYKLGTYTKKRLLKIMSEADVLEIDRILREKLPPAKVVDNRIISHPILQFVFELEKPTITDIEELMSLERRLGFKFKKIEEIKMIAGRLKEEKAQSQSA